jgi:methyl-accepting chemotaxis protein
MVDASVVIKEMGKRSEDIGDIVQTINMLADRTNLLSLNASIEAARAGEHGRGFAVVAEEIRVLADRAAAASADIAKIVRGLQSTAREAVQATSEGLKVADEAARLAGDAERGLSTVMGGVDELNRAIREIDR